MAYGRGCAVEMELRNSYMVELEGFIENSAVDEDHHL
jgi:hypothetical protein